MDALAGQVAVVTGAGSGMGRAFAHRFAAEGMRVVAADIQRDALAATVDELTAHGHETIGVPTDVSSATAVADLAAAAVAAFGGVQLLCNNAGVEGYLDGPIWEATDKDWAWTVDVNYWSVVHGIRAFVPIMIDSGRPGHVVNTASMTAVIAAGNMYGITKHAVLALSEVLRSDLRKRDLPIGVTALCPGTIATNLFHGIRNRPAELVNETDTSGAADGRELRERMHSVLAAGMPPAEVADLLVAAIRADAPYLLTDHEWDDQITARHEALLAAAESTTGTENGR
jgi:NAD(P)-dependent dehydrogenase (short-subunit alcohol dehydrogenase family)